MANIIPSLSLPSNDLTAYFAEPSLDSANNLAALINKDLATDPALVNQGTPNSLDNLLTSITQQTLTFSLAHPEKIDDYINFLSYAALQINSAVAHPGDLVDDGKTPYKSVTLRPSNGPNILGERLSKTLYEAMWDATSRAYTPFEDDDRGQPTQYYYKAYVHATILARAFALGAETFREALWRNVEDLIVKALFSGDEQEPGVFVAIAAVFLGTGNSLKEYMGDGKPGRGKAWLWYDDVRTKSDEKWGWEDVVKALRNQPEKLMESRLPEDIKAGFELLKKEVGDELTMTEEWDSKRLANEVFKWTNLDS